MSRVERDNQTRRAEQQRHEKVRDEAQMKEAKQKFAQTMGKQQAAQKQQQTTQQAGQQKFVGQRNAHAALMARQGLQSQAKFQSLIKTSTQENVKRAESDTKNRTEDLQEKSTARA